VQQLGEVCKKVEYGTSSKAQPQGKLPVLRMGNIQNGRFEWKSLVYSNNEEDNKQYLLYYNDVLFNRTNSPELVGKTAIYKGERPAIFAGYLIRLHRKEDLLDADYLNYYLNSKMAFEYGKTVVISSVNQANINGTKLKTYPIPLPTLEEQQFIVHHLDALRAETQKLEALYQKKIDNLEELKKSILQKAFAGELKTEKAIAV
jgi:type I restriction enzyme S subunit